MNRKKIIIGIAILFIIFVMGVLCYIKQVKKNNNTQNNKITEELVESKIDKKQVSYRDEVTVDELKKETSITGDSSIYDIETEYDGRKALVVKASLKYKVAFAGMIKKDVPQVEELDEILEKKEPKKNGIWVPEESQDKVLKLLNNNQKTQSEYTINNEGYIIISNKNNQTNIDKKIEKILKSNKQYILDVSGVCYIVDNVTGEIYDWNFEEIDEVQAYEYFEDGNKMIMFITENSKGQFTNEEILESIIELL